MQWALSGKDKVDQASIYDLNGVVHRYFFMFSNIGL
jgi:hypothetical protein